MYFWKVNKLFKSWKELNLCLKLKFSNPYIYIYGTWCCRLLIFLTKIIWCNRIHSLKYLRSTTMGCKDRGIWKSEFVSKTLQFLCPLSIRGINENPTSMVEPLRGVDGSSQCFKIQNFCSQYIWKELKWKICMTILSFYFEYFRKKKE